MSQGYYRAIKVFAIMRALSACKEMFSRSAMRSPDSGIRDHISAANKKFMQIDRIYLTAAEQINKIRAAFCNKAGKVFCPLRLEA
tara:strand:- start:2978 stop:3232 length:255 start_codon:yes stop_codon:yes gene_type:complete